MKLPKTNDELYEIIIPRIKQALRNYGYKNYEMAEIIGVSAGVFNNKINNASGRFSLLELLKIADELYLSLEDLLNYSDN